MNLVLAISFAGTAVSLRTQSGNRAQSMSTVSLPFSFDAAKLLPVPSSDVFSRYCHVDPATTPRLRQSSLMEYGGEEDAPEQEPKENLVYGKCQADSDCHGHRPYCIDSICRECREGYEFEDCGTTMVKCNEESKFTCSECVNDEECRSSTFCRSVFHRKSFLQKDEMARNECVKCESAPLFAEVVDTNSCHWRCPIESYYKTGLDGEADSCVDCPVCGSGQFYAPVAVTPTKFFTQCTNATDVVCTDCAKIGVDSSSTDFCAAILSPADTHQDDITVGDLGSEMPCRFFQCKDSWFLDSSVNKCKKCHVTMCAPGEFLGGCGGTNPGKCQACKGRLPRGGEWIDPTDAKNNIKGVDHDTCQFTCPIGTVYDEDDNRCVKCDRRAKAGEDHACDPEGKVYKLSGDD